MVPYPTKKKETSPWCWNSSNKNNEGRRRNGAAQHSCSTPLFAVLVLLVNTIFWIWHSTSANPNVYDAAANRMMMAMLGANQPSTTTAASTTEHFTSQSTDAAAVGLLNHNVIRSHLLAEAPWAESHGADHNLYLGAGLLYYSFAYAFQSRTIVALGSGGGFVPRVLRQAQRDLELALPGDGPPFRLILVDAHLPSAGWGSTFYAENEDTVMRQKFRDIRYVFQKTDDAFVMLRDEGITIDYLHVDADHSFEQSWKDFAQFSTLLSDRAVVSFHDTCHPNGKMCRTGVPETMARLSERLDEYQLQLIDTHYLYRGMAFAVPAQAPMLKTPADYKLNFCKNNAAALAKSSNGFTQNNRTGSVPSLGDFFKCYQRFNMTALGAPCPFGSRRDNKKGGNCSLCIPGMKGDDCQTFRYADERTKSTKSKQLATADMRNRHRLAAAWLADQDSQHIFEFGVSGTEPVSKHLWHDNVKSVVAVDPRIEKPVWTEDGETPAVRWLPTHPEEVIGGRYSDLVSLQSVDALVCLQCDDQISNPSLFGEMLQTFFPQVTTVVLEGSVQKQRLDKMAKALLAPSTATTTTTTAWEIQTDITLDSNNKKRDGEAAPRRMMLLTKISVVPKQDFRFSEFEVAGVNLASYDGRLEETKPAKRTTKAEPFELFDDFDLSDMIVGNETWKDLVRYRRDVKRQSLCFYVDKVARKRWLPSVGIPGPKTFLLKYASELTESGRIEDEQKTILDQLPRNRDYAAKPTHLSCSGGVWLTKTTGGPNKNTTMFITHGTKPFQAADNNFELKQIADSLAQDLHEGPRCGKVQESWALENVKPGVMIEERFTTVEGDDDAGGMEFKVITIFGRVWLAQWRPGVSTVRAFIYRNGTTLDWEEESSEPLPDWVDWPRIVAMAEQLGAHKDMFRTDIFVGVPAGSVPAGASKEERLAAVQYVVSETEIHPTPLKDTDEIFKEAGRLWLAGYKIGNYRVVPDTEVPPEFVETGSLSVQA